MRNLKLTVAYDGTNYAGWQTQKNAPTVQEAIEKVLERILQQKIRLIGSSRTDAGAHAVGQAANFICRGGFETRPQFLSLRPVGSRLHQARGCSGLLIGREQAHGTEERPVDSCLQIACAGRQGWRSLGHTF